MRHWGLIVGALLIVAALLVACSDDPLGFSYKDLPPGDAANGADVFMANRCSACHALDDAKSAGPSLQGFGERAGSRVKDQSAEDYTFTSILRPTKHIVQGFSNVMPDDYEKKLSRQDLADVIAYVLGL